MAEEVKLDRKEIKELEKFIIKRIEEIVFGTNRPSGIQKKVGGLKIQDSVGGNQKLRKSIQRNKSFIKQDKKGLEINIKNLPPYWKYLDDERVDDYNWYLSEAIFDDSVISKKIKEVIAGAYKRYVLNILK